MNHQPVILIKKSDLARNKFSDINENSSDEEIIKNITKYYSKRGNDVNIKIENNTIIIKLEGEENISTPQERMNDIIKLAENGQYNTAKQKIKEQLKIYNKDSELYRLYGQILSDEGNLPEAEKWLIDCLKYNPENIRGLVMLGNIYNNQGKKELAKKLYKRAINKNDSDIYALSNYGSLCIELGDFKEAKDALDKALEIDSEYRVVNYSQGIVEYNLGNYLEAFNFALKAQKNTDKRDPRAKSIMKLLINTAEAQDKNLVIEALYIPLKEQLEKELGKKILFKNDDSIRSVARIKIAEHYGTNEHIILFNTKKFGYKYSIMHELIHLKMISDARKIGKNKVIGSDWNKKQELIKHLKRNSTYIQKQYEANFESYTTDILTQLYNSPLDLYVENDLFNKYKELRPSQFLFQMQLIISAIDVAHNKDLEERVPKLIYDSNIIMNSIIAQQIKDLYGVDYTGNFGHEDLVETGKELYDKFNSQKDSMEPGDEYELIKIWAYKLGFKDYFEYNNEDLDEKINSGLHIEDDSENYSIDEIQEEVKKISSDSNEINITIVMYCLKAIHFFRTKSKKETSIIAYELAVKGQGGIKYGEDSKYYINSIPGKEFSGYEFLSYLYVAWQILKPDADLGLDYSKEYELAKQIDSKK